MAALKGDFVTGAYSMLRISGLTINPSADDDALALKSLEGMAAEYFKRNIDVGYNFEDTPNPNSAHNVPVEYWYAFETNLAARIVFNFGNKELPASLARMQQQSFSFLSASTAPIRQTQYPSRMPIGSGNSLRWNRHQEYYRPIPEPPLSSSTNGMIVGNINDYVEHFDSYLNVGETVASYTIEADEGLTIVSDSLTSPDVDYQISAVGNSGTTTDNLLQVIIVATTSAGRVETRLINFSLTKVEL